MKIIIRESPERKPITIRIPTRGIITGLGPIALSAGAVSISGVQKKLTYRQARKVCRALIDGKKCLNGEPLVEVLSGDGEQVVIYL